MHGYGGSHKSGQGMYGGSHGSHDGKIPKRIRKSVKGASGKRLLPSEGGEKYKPRAQGTKHKIKTRTETYISLKGGKSAKIGMAPEESGPVSKKQFTQLHSKKQMKNLKKAGRIMETKMTYVKKSGGVKRAKPYRA